MEQEDPLLARIRESDMQRSRWMHEVFGGQTLHPDMEQQIRDVVMDQCSPNPVAQATGPIIYCPPAARLLPLPPDATPYGCGGQINPIPDTSALQKLDELLIKSLKEGNGNFAHIDDYMRICGATDWRARCREVRRCLQGKPISYNKKRTVELREAIRPYLQNPFIDFRGFLFDSSAPGLCAIQHDLIAVLEHAYIRAFRPDFLGFYTVHSDNTLHMGSKAAYRLEKEFPKLLISARGPNQYSLSLTEAGSNPVP